MTQTDRQVKLDEKSAFTAYKKWARPIAHNMSKRFKNERQVAIEDIMQEGLVAIYENGLTLDISDDNQRKLASRAMNAFSIREYRYGLDKSTLTFEKESDGFESFTIEIGVLDDGMMYVENLDFWVSCASMMGEETRKAMVYYYKHGLNVEQIMIYTNVSKRTVYRRLKEGNDILIAADLQIQAINTKKESDFK